MQGLDVDVSSAGSLARSLQALRDAVLDPAVMDVVQLLATKPMQVRHLHSLPPSAPPPPKEPLKPLLRPRMSLVQGLP